jgi:hypothetical protein
MDAVECRKRAASCLRSAGKASGELRSNFLLAAETWLSVAEQLERAAVSVPAMRIAALADIV